MNKKHKIQRDLTVLALLTAILAVLSAYPISLAMAQVNPPPWDISLNPQEAETGVGNVVNQTLEASPSGGGPVTGEDSALFGIELEITFDPSIVQVVDADAQEPGVQITPSSVFNRSGVQVIINSADNASGLIRFVANVTGQGDPLLTQAGSLATIGWRGVSEGQAQLQFTGKGSTKNGFPIELMFTTGTVTVVSNSPSGTVLLQGRTDHSGTVITLIEEACPAGVWINSLVTKIAETVTDQNGFFEFQPLPGKTFGCLLAFKHAYLTAQHSDPQGNLGTITLLGGDVNEDDKINIFDLAYIASRYKGTDLTADVNGDGLVDILDLTITGGNYGKTGPLTVWQTNP
jgi:hypothetical protein